MAVVFFSISILGFDIDFIFGKFKNYFLGIYTYLFSAGAVFALLMTLIALFIDCYVLGYEKSAIKRLLNPSLSARSDLFLYLFSFLGLMRIFSIFFTLGLLYFFPKWVDLYLGVDLQVQFESPIVHLFFFFVLQDFIEYWRHRWAHRISWWWQLHKVHHSALEFNVITVARSHPVELALGSIIAYIPMSLIGMGIESYLIIKIFYSLQGKLQHSMIHWRWGWIGKYVFISPIDHRIHHSCMKEHWDKNFGHITPLWDRIFGTWYDGNVINEEITVTDNYLNKKGFVLDMIESYKKFLQFMFLKRWSFGYGIVKKK